LKNKYFTSSSRRIILFNTFTMLIFYGIFNAFFLVLLNRDLEKEIDLALIHEMDHFQTAIDVVGDSIEFINKDELTERGLRELTEKPYFLQVLDKTGRILHQSPNTRFLSGIPVHFPLYFDTLTFANYYVDQFTLRTCYAPIKENGKIYGYIQLSTPKSAGKKLISNVIFFDLITFPLVLLVILGIAYMNAQQYLAPIRKIIAVTRRISATDLSQRLDYEADPEDEMGQLRETLNHLFDRLEKQIKQIAQFTDNAAHQLMSPLTILKTELEFITRRKHSNPDCAQSFQVLIEQTDRMIKIINTLLIIAKDDVVHQIESSIISVNKIIDQLKTYYPERVDFSVPKNSLFLKGNPEYFSMAIQNLIDNALKYSEEDSTVKVQVMRKNKYLKITVIDEGIGIPDFEKNRIFERFYRSETANSKKGFGLGLSLVQTVVKQMNGSIKVKDNKPRGTIFELKFKLLHLE